MSKTILALALKGSSAQKAAPQQAAAPGGLEALWASIPPSAKAVRGGQRYVVVEGSGMRTLEDHELALRAEAAGMPDFETFSKEYDAKAKAAAEKVPAAGYSLGPIQLTPSDHDDGGGASPAFSIDILKDGAVIGTAEDDGWGGGTQILVEGDLAEGITGEDLEFYVDGEVEKAIRDHNSRAQAKPKSKVRPKKAVRSAYDKGIATAIEAAKKKAPEPTAIPEINPKQADPRLKDKQTEDAHYDELKPGKRPAVVILNKKGSDGKLYEARSVSDEDLQEKSLEFALAQWCPSMGEARRMAKVLEENRQDKTPQPSTWPADKSPQALDDKQIKALPSGTEKVDRMRRADVTARRRVKASQEVKAGSPGWYSEVRKNNKIGDLNRGQTGRQAERLMNIMQQAIDKVAQAEPGEPFMTDRAWMDAHRAKLSKEILKRVKPGVDPKVYLVLEDENYHFLNELLDTLGLYGSPEAAPAPVPVTAAGGEGAAAEGETAGDPDPERKPATQSVTLTLNDAEAAELAKRFGYKLDADSFEDVNHGGYTAEDGAKMSLPKKFDGAESLFPGEVAMAAEDADRDAVAAKIVEASKDALVEALTQVDASKSDYYDDGLQMSIPTLGAAVTSAAWDGWNLSLTIQDPALLYNWLMAGMGYFATEIDPYEPMDEAEVKDRLYLLPDYFQIMGDRKPEISDVDASPSDDDFAYHLEYRLRESGDVDVPRASSAIIDKMDEDFERPAAGDDAEAEGWFDEAKGLAVKVAEWTGLDAEELVKAVETKLKSGQPGGSEDMKKKEAEGQLKLLESRRAGSVLFLKAKGLVSPRAAEGGAQRGLPFVAEISEADEIAPERVVEALKDIARSYARGEETMGVLDMYQRAAAAVVGAEEAAKVVKTAMESASAPVQAAAPYQAQPMKKGPKFDKTTGFMPREGLYPSGDPVKAVPGNGSSRFKFQKLRRVEGKESGPAQRARFAWDMDDQPYEGYDLTPQLGFWNGFDSPGFEKAVADKICAQNMKDHAHDPKYRIFYDAAKDAYMEVDPEYNGDEEIEVGPAIQVETVDGPKKLYTLGAWMWTWNAIDEEEPVEGSFRAFRVKVKAAALEREARMNREYAEGKRNDFEVPEAGKLTVQEMRDEGWAESDIESYLARFKAAAESPGPAPDAVAHAFADVLKEWLTPEQVAEANAKNKTDDYDDSVCASHDYCDANMAMDEAFKKVDPAFYAAAWADNEATGGEGKVWARMTDIWNEAWGIAKRADFWATPQTTPAA